MELRSICHRGRSARGFTLVEILVVLAIFALLVGVGVTFSIDAYRGNIFRSERGVLVSVLERARSRAITNYQQSSWGVCYIAPNYVIFKGVTCTSGTDTVPANQTIAAASSFGSFPTIVFSQLAGTTTGASITLMDGVSAVNTSTITINNEGTIIW